ncbi:MAG: hypothetical protein JXA66_04125 [Oligoflexia bacterium]|nr:hypothetical protein [Oligoflexia bacterium]
MAVPRTARRWPQSGKAHGVVNLNSIRTKKVFSNVKGLGFSLLSSGVARVLVKSPLTLLAAPHGELGLRDPALLLTLDIIGQGKGVVYLSMNASRDEIIAKLVLALSGLNETMVKKGALLGESRDTFEKACGIIYNSNLHVAEGGIVNQLWIKLKELKSRARIDALIIDDLYSIGFEITDNENTDYQDLLEYFNDMSVNIGIPIVVISRPVI